MLHEQQCYIIRAREQLTGCVACKVMSAEHVCMTAHWRGGAAGLTWCFVAADWLTVILCLPKIQLWLHAACKIWVAGRIPTWLLNSKPGGAITKPNNTKTWISCRLHSQLCLIIAETLCHIQRVCSPIRVFRHCPDAVSQIRLQTDRHTDTWTGQRQSIIILHCPAWGHFANLCVCVCVCVCVFVCVCAQMYHRPS